jgi:hypothetical protein
VRVALLAAGFPRLICGNEGLCVAPAIWIMAYRAVKTGFAVPAMHSKNPLLQQFSCIRHCSCTCVMLLSTGATFGCCAACAIRVTDGQPLNTLASYFLAAAYPRTAAQCAVFFHNCITTGCRSRCVRAAVAQLRRLSVTINGPLWGWGYIRGHACTACYLFTSVPLARICCHSWYSLPTYSHCCRCLQARCNVAGVMP